MSKLEEVRIFGAKYGNTIFFDPLTDNLMQPMYIIAVYSNAYTYIFKCKPQSMYHTVTTHA